MIETDNLEAPSNLVLGIVVRGDRSGPLPRVSPFLLSLQQTGYQGDCVFFHPEGDSLTAWAIESLGAAPEPFRRCFPHLGESDNEQLLALRGLLEQVDFDRFSIVYQRHVVFLEYLVANRHRYKDSLVLMCDTLDAVFQSDPFEGMGDKLYFFLDDDVSPDEARFRKWATKCFGEETLAEMGLLDVLRENHMVNAGVVLGSYDKIVAYLKEMISLIGKLRPTRKYLHGDQVLFNHVCYRSGLDGACLVENGRHVANVSRVAPGTLLHSKGRDISYHGHEPAAIVHMYNRRPELNGDVLARYSLWSALVASVKSGDDWLNLLLLCAYDYVANLFVVIKKQRAALGKWYRKALKNLP